MKHKTKRRFLPSGTGIFYRLYRYDVKKDHATKEPDGKYHYRRLEIWK